MSPFDPPIDYAALERVIAAKMLGAASEPVGLSMCACCNLLGDLV